MYNTRPGLLIGFHGCDKSQQQLLLGNPLILPVSANPYEWLGHGLYFWENNYDRAFEWAKAKELRGEIKEAAVVGAVIDLMYCCDLLDTHFINIVSNSFRGLKLENIAAGIRLPENKDVSSDINNDKLLRFRDCAVFEFMHAKFRWKIKRDIDANGFSNLKLFDSVRGVFTEGGPAFDGAGFEAKNHIQICVRNPNCIKGFFRKREEIDYLSRELLARAS
jgi:hypothetical protein